MRESKRVRFPNANGELLSGILDTPPEPKFCALFSHCFTCSKDLKAIVRISRRLAELGIAVLRYDFTGLGESEGVFETTNFTTTCADTLAAVDFMKSEFQSPSLLVGHSLGGTAFYQVAEKIPSAKCLVTISSPSCTTHLSDFLESQDPNVKATGNGSVVIGNRPVPITKQLIDDLKSQKIPDQIKSLPIPLMAIHSPVDETLPFWHSQNAVQWAPNWPTLVTLPGSDHLLVNQPEDLPMVAGMIDCWSDRFCQ